MLAQRRVAEHGGEPAVLEGLLAGLDVRGALISLDAASCHPSAAGAIVARGADYLIALKGNQRALHAATRDWFAARAFTVGGGLRPCADSMDSGHGRAVAPVRVRGPTRPRCPGPTTSSPPGRACAASSPWRPSASWRTPRRARRGA